MHTYAIKSISQTDREAMQQKLDQLAKPIAGLGRLEELAVTIAGIQHQSELSVSKRCCLVFAADHGVASEGVSATPQKVTAIQSVNLLNGHTAAGAMAASVHCGLEVIDMGVRASLPDKRIIHRKIRWGTRDMLVEPAMTRDEAQQSIETGREVAKQAIADGNRVLLLGELGIANTTAAAAILAARYALSPAQTVGYGSNISEKRYQHKIDVVTQALHKWQPASDDALEILRTVGGYEIGGNAGAIIGAAEEGVPIILDGFISYAALSLAELLVPGIEQHVIASHASKESGTALVTNLLNINPLLDLNLAVGEGTGALLVLPLIDAIQSVLTQMNTQTDMQFGYQP
ncbi:nicotinate-nucleotide--dimethylbenzimidazole phosphoribosyltransferase [Secundilactobacillus hailunensis]|uniref:Nicotinate-nucleotide--dimethylbenzimidazole phosphoribosyltransferase n=1 Tax=Secundilactobacillus hailunensis TaxID=2559923 RepID=A0ABW1TCX9_9LACO|nr:nicotinate-nucleotide--dimethylbenzimidazole phosphoribosyltransferase [Secundilactobacillus hailunensis]